MSEAVLYSGGARYTRVAMVLHWLVAALLVLNVGLGLSADYVSDSAVRAVIDLHKSVGITVLGLVILRILWRLSHKPPSMPEGYTPWERLTAHVTHAALYIVILALPISGWMHDSAWKGAATHPILLYWLVPWPRIGWIQNVEPHHKETLHTVFFAVHAYAAYALYALLALHIIGALKHQFWDRAPELQRMLPGR
jgi:cytochrome b561